MADSASPDVLDLGVSLRDLDRRNGLAVVDRASRAWTWLYSYPFIVRNPLKPRKWQHE